MVDAVESVPATAGVLVLDRMPLKEPAEVVEWVEDSDTKEVSGELELDKAGLVGADDGVEDTDNVLTTSWLELNDVVEVVEAVEDTGAVLDSKKLTELV